MHKNNNKNNNYIKMANDSQNKLTESEMTEMQAVFSEIDTDDSGLIDQTELRSAFEKLGIKIPGYKVREMVTGIDKDEDEKVNLTEFQQLTSILKKEGRVDFTNLVRPRSGIEYHTGMSNASSDGTTHAVSRQEQVAFANWINRSLKSDSLCKQYLPIEEGTNDIFMKVNDGVLLCKLINQAQPNTIDDRVINLGVKMSIFKKNENQTLALQSAEAIGCCIVNMRPDDLIRGKPHLVLGLLWQIIKVGLLGQINLHDCNQLCVLLREGEEIEDLQALSPEEILIRWVNYHLERAGTDRRIGNFSGDIMDSEIYLHLLGQVAPKDKGVCVMPVFGIQDTKKRAEAMLGQADLIDCKAFVTPQDVVSGNAKLNMAFVANIFNNQPALDMKDYDGEEIEVEENTDEKIRMQLAHYQKQTAGRRNSRLDNQLYHDAMNNQEQMMVSNNYTQVHSMNTQAAFDFGDYGDTASNVYTGATLRRPSVPRTTTTTTTKVTTVKKKFVLVRGEDNQYDVRAIDEDGKLEIVQLTSEQKEDVIQKLVAEKAEKEKNMPKQAPRQYVFVLVLEDDGETYDVRAVNADGKFEIVKMKEDEKEEIYRNLLLQKEELSHEVCERKYLLVVNEDTDAYDVCLIDKNGLLSKVEDLKEHEKAELIKDLLDKKQLNIEKEKPEAQYILVVTADDRATDIRTVDSTGGVVAVDLGEDEKEEIIQRILAEKKTEAFADVDKDAYILVVDDKGQAFDLRILGLNGEVQTVKMTDEERDRLIDEVVLEKQNQVVDASSAEQNNTNIYGETYAGAEYISATEIQLELCENTEMMFTSESSVRVQNAPPMQRKLSSTQSNQMFNRRVSNSGGGIQEEEDVGDWRVGRSDEEIFVIEQRMIQIKQQMEEEERKKQIFRRLQEQEEKQTNIRHEKCEFSDEKKIKNKNNYGGRGK